MKPIISLTRHLRPTCILENVYAQPMSKRFYLNEKIQYKSGSDYRSVSKCRHWDAWMVARAFLGGCWLVTLKLLKYQLKCTFFPFSTSCQTSSRSQSNLSSRFWTWTDISLQIFYRWQWLSVVIRVPHCERKVALLLFWSLAFIPGLVLWWANWYGQLGSSAPALMACTRASRSL